MEDGLNQKPVGEQQDIEKLLVRMEVRRRGQAV
jgi:hypothetical protein